MGGTALLWFKSFLKGRSQHYRLGLVLSDDRAAEDKQVENPTLRYSDIATQSLRFACNY